MFFNWTRLYLNFLGFGFLMQISIESIKCFYRTYLFYMFIRLKNLFWQQTDEEKGWSHAGGDSLHHQPSQPLAEETSDWCETEPTSAEDSWANQAEQQWSQPAQAQQNDGQLYVVKYLLPVSIILEYSWMLL